MTGPKLVDRKDIQQVSPFASNCSRDVACQRRRWRCLGICKRQFQCFRSFKVIRTSFITSKRTKTNPRTPIPQPGFERCSRAALTLRPISIELHPARFITRYAFVPCRPFDNGTFNGISSIPHAHKYYQIICLLWTPSFPLHTRRVLFLLLAEEPFYVLHFFPCRDKITREKITRDKFTQGRNYTGQILDTKMLR